MTVAADAPPALRIGCLGAARIAPDAIVWPARSRGDVALTVIAGRDKARAEAFAAQHGFARVATGYEEVVAAPDVDLVYNPLPISLHAEWSIRAMEAGKDVLCEKPFAMNVEEARAMLETARRTGRRIIEALHYRYHPAYAAFLGWMREGRIGRVRRFEASLTVAIPDTDGAEIRHRPALGGGAFMDLGCYPLSSVLMAIEGDPVILSATATMTPSGVDESLIATLGFGDGVEARLEASMAMDVATCTVLTVTGDEGRIVFENPSVPQRGYALRLERGGAIETAPVDRSTTYVHQMKALVEGLASGEALPTEGDAIMRQQTALDAIYAAAGLRDLRYR